MALFIALLLSVKFHKSDEWFIVEVTLVSSYFCSNNPTISAIIEIKGSV